MSDQKCEIAAGYVQQDSEFPPVRWLVGVILGHNYRAFGGLVLHGGCAFIALWFQIYPCAATFFALHFALLISART